MGHGYKPSIDSEMHELHAEADFLEAKTVIAPAGANGEDTKLQSHNSDPDAQAMVIESLRAQVQDLFSQVTQLNNKLVRSYDRVSDLEDELHVTSSNLRQATLKISQLELERTQHLSALSTGLLVEKSHVTTELNRLMEKATEEAARRGQAETARAEIEKELDDLSAGLFNQANTMVAEARMAEARSARKLEETESALRGAEEIVGVLQAQMQALQAEKEHADRRVEEMRARMGKGKWVDRSPDGRLAHRRRLLSTHVPYHEFLIFVSHLRAIRPASAQPPAMSTLLPLPLLARLVAEDSDPTVRLDLAPSLNWLSRRSVLAAIHSGQLTVEPMQFSTLLEELAPPTIPANSHHTHIACALCGLPIYTSAGDSTASTPTTPNSARNGSSGGSWSSSLFKNVRSADIATQFNGQNRQLAQYPQPSAEPPTLVYIFRLEATSSGLPVSLPLSSQQSGAPTKQSTIYPLCMNGWCLARLRTTCSLWAYVRTSIVEKIWEEPALPDRPNGTFRTGVNGIEHKHESHHHRALGLEKPGIQPRRSKMGLSSLWGSMQRSISGALEKDAPPVKEDARPKLPPRDPSRKSLPPPPPVHPASASHHPTQSMSAGGQVHRVPPPLPKRNKTRDVQTASSRPGTPAPEAGPVAEKPQAETAESQPARGSSEAPSPTSAHEQPKEEDAPIAEPVPAPTSAPAPSELVVPAPSIARSESHDSFTTPTEELASAFSASSPAPTTVPLPPSQAPTPEPAARASTEHPALDPVPTDADKPAAAVPTALQDEKEKPPSRTGSPVPPPLPRRAAARGRPSSVIVPPQPAEVPKPEGGPQPQAEAAPSDGAALVVEEPQAIAEDPQETVYAQDTPAGAKDTPGPDTSVPDAKEAQPQPAAARDKQPDPEPPLDGNTDADSAFAKPVPEPESRSSGESVQTTDTSEAVEKDDGQSEAYVGDGTWEERTYRELVRLREEMFWARVGGVAQ